MVIQVIYIFECKDGFKFIRDTFEEIKKIVDDNYKALQDMAKDGDSVSMTMDYNNKYFPSASISACIGGTWKFYTLRTEVLEMKRQP